jgi:hypothetical protein
VIGVEENAMKKREKWFLVVTILFGGAAGLFWALYDPLWTWSYYIIPVIGIEDTYVSWIDWTSTWAWRFTVMTSLFLAIWVIMRGFTLRREIRARREKRRMGFDILKAEIARGKEKLTNAWGRAHIRQLEKALNLLE